MASAPGKGWSSRWLPALFTIVAATQVGGLLAQAFVWHAAPFILEAQGGLAAVFVGLAVLFQWDLRRPKAPLPRPTEF